MSQFVVILMLASPFPLFRWGFVIYTAVHYHGLLSVRTTVGSCFEWMIGLASSYFDDPGNIYH